MKDLLKRFANSIFGRRNVPSLFGIRAVNWRKPKPVITQGEASVIENEQENIKVVLFSAIYTFPEGHC